MLQFLMMHGVGALGGSTAKRLRVPAGAMIGAMIAVMLFNSLTGSSAAYPGTLRTAIQAASGAVIGSRFSRADLKELRQIVKPAIFLLLSLFGLNLLFAYLIAKAGALSLTTSLFASAPGGVSDLALIAADFGANTQTVALLQMFRFIFVVAFFPPFMKKRYLKATPASLESPATPPAAQKAAFQTHLFSETLLPLAAAGAGGFFLRAVGVPAGAVIGALAATVAMSLARGKVRLPGSFKTGVQLLCGCYIGNQVTRDAIFSIGELLLPMLLLLLEVLAMAFIGAWLIHKCTKMDLITSLFSCIPGGIAEMGLIAEELGLDTPKIVVMHTCRVIACICFLPLLVRLF